MKSKKLSGIIRLGLTLPLLILPILACSSNSTQNPPVPVTPTGLNGIALSSNAIFLSWQDNSTDETGFSLYRKPANVPVWTRIVQLPFDSYSYNDSNLVDSTAYSYYIIAFNAAGNSPASAPTTITTFAIGLPPEQPSFQVPWNGADSVALNPVMSWECSDPDGDTLTFDIYLGTGTPPGIAVANLADTTVQFHGLLPDTIYYWQVTALDPHKHRTPSPIWFFRTIP
jgi:hypothetical protein